MMDIKMVCEDCGKEAPVDKERSNESWVIYKNQCDECGGKTAPKFQEGEGGL